MATLLGRLRRTLRQPSLPERRMCMRCDEMRSDVPYWGARCPACQEIVDEIFRTNPQAFWDYLDLMNRARRDSR
jgi:hypothetical protein